MFICSDKLDSKLLVLILSQVAIKESFRVIPLFFDQEDSLKVVCPYCSFEKRCDLPELEVMKTNDYWLNIFERKKSRQHFINVNARPATIDSGFTIRAFSDKDRRSKYANIDTPIFKELGFRGYNFDKCMFVPLVVHRTDAKHIRVGILNPDRIDGLLQRVFSSLLFRVKEVPPITIPDILPISTIGDIKISEPTKITVSHDKDVEVCDFINLLIERADKKEYRVLQKLSLATSKGGPKNSNNAGCSDHGSV